MTENAPDSTQNFLYTSSCEEREDISSIWSRDTEVCKKTGVVGTGSGYIYRYDYRFVREFFSGSDWKTDGFYGLQKTTELDIDRFFIEKSCCFFVLNRCVCERMVFGAGGAVLPTESLGMVFSVVLNLCEVSGHGKEGYT